MCGIVLHYRNPWRPAEQQRFDQALLRLAHRGPNAQQQQPLLSADDTHPQQVGAIGHTRLSIIALADSHQPMYSMDRRYQLSFNGEIYNYRELRQKLQPHWSFTTCGDTEVLLAGLITQGTDFLTQLKGMWAFALYDRQQQQIIMARDPVGKKPLFFCHSADQCLLASELPTLRALLSESPSICPQAQSHYFQFGFMPPGHTIYQSILEVLPGETVCWQSGQPLQRLHYWRLPQPEPFSGSVLQAQQQLQQYLTQAVRHRLIADVEVGCLLSGGVDSSIVAYLAAQASSKPLKTFCMGFSDQHYDERRYAQQVAQHIGSEHIEHCISRVDAQLLAQLVCNHIGQPFADASLLPTYMAYQLAGQHLSVVLNGDGADELFCGYRRYQARWLMQRLHLNRPPLPAVLTALSHALGDSPAHHSRSLRKRLRLLADLCQQTSPQHISLAPNLFTPAQYQNLFPGSTFIHAQPLDTGIDPVDQMMRLDLQHYLPQAILVKVDRAAMAHAVEPRSPFLDRDLLTWALSLPLSMKQHWRQGKWLLTQTFAHALPKATMTRKKQGFAVPLGLWFCQDLGDQLLQRLHDTPCPALCTTSVTQLLQQHRQGQQDWGLQLWLIYSYLLWQAQA